MTAPLLTTKLYPPPPRPHVVPRPHLIERLNDGLERGHRLTLVSAPAGFGKTTLIGEWLRREERPHAWLSLDESDNDPARFLTYLSAALQEIHPEWGRAFRPALQSPHPPLMALVATLVNQIAANGIEFILALDDYHVISAQPVHDILVFLVDHMPPQMHLVILTRADPPLPLARLRGRDQLTELRQADLRFAIEESAAFLNRAMNLELTPPQIAALETRTEGWVAGLQLAALSLQEFTQSEDVASFIKTFAGSNRYVMDYLIQEVFDRQPADVQEFLLQTSILDRLSGPLCEALTGRSDGQEMLEKLDRANLFTVPLDHERRWYRYHHLFSDLLHDRLEEESSPQRLASLHHQASRWYEEAGLAAEAFRHALAAQDRERAARLVEENAGSMIWRGEAVTLLHWLDALPDEMVRSRPRLCVYCAWALFIAGRVGAAEMILQEAEKALAGPTASPATTAQEGDIAQLLAEATVMRLLFSHTRDDDLEQRITLSQQALEQVDEGNRFTRGMLYLDLGIALRRSGDMARATQALVEAVRLCQAAGEALVATIAAYNLVRLYEIQGQRWRAAETCQQMLRSAEERAGAAAEALPSLGMIHLGLAYVLYEENELEAAEKHAQKGIALGELGGYVGALTNGYARLMRVRQARGDPQGAREALCKLEQAMQQRNVPPPTMEEVATYRAWLWVAQGNLAAAERWARTVQVHPDEHLDTLGEFKALTLVRVLLAQGKPGTAVPLLERLLRAAESEGRVGKAIEILALQALAHQARGDETEALETLTRALALAEPEGYVRTFVDEGAPMAALLSRALKAEQRAGTGDVSVAYVRQLLAAFDELAVPALSEPLTRRELEVLHLVAAGLRNQEIADRLFISVATVKRHITNLHGKLGVTRRTQAVARAQKLGLL